MTFLVLLLSSVYSPDAGLKCTRCAVHPLCGCRYWQNEITYYAADMNVLLAYFNLLDDWNDDKNMLAYLGAKVLENSCRNVSYLYPEKFTAIKQCLSALSEIERSGELNPDIPANCFGELMGEIFVFRNDGHAQDLRKFGKALGKFIYIMDACLDLKADIKKERYNPMVSLSSEIFPEILNLLMADCVEKYKKLPVERDKNIIENVLYSGVWTRYEAAKAKKEKGRGRK